MIDAELRRLYMQIATRRRSAERVGCVVPEAMLAIVQGHAHEAERVQALHHIASCGSCRPEFELLRSAAEAARGLTHGS
ncbi:MAG TPA: hypothetical protein VM736_03560 [Gemmatimonadales bacterium]|nr:hypothetical protein [Gemmatimonadales bacterium]